MREILQGHGVHGLQWGLLGLPICRCGDRVRGANAPLFYCIGRRASEGGAPNFQLYHVGRILSSVFCEKIFLFFFLKGVDIKIGMCYYDDDRRGERQNTPRRSYHLVARAYVTSNPNTHSHQKFCPRPRASRSFFFLFFF